MLINNQKPSFSPGQVAKVDSFMKLADENRDGQLSFDEVPFFIFVFLLVLML